MAKVLREGCSEITKKQKETLVLTERVGLVSDCHCTVAAVWFRGLLTQRR